VVFTQVISQIFLPWVPTNIIHLMCDLVTYPEESHFHQTRLLPLDGVVGNADGRSIIAVHGVFGCGWPVSFRIPQKTIAIWQL
jgi:hypothetical protein